MTEFRVPLLLSGFFKFKSAPAKLIQ